MSRYTNSGQGISVGQTISSVYVGFFTRSVLVTRIVLGLFALLPGAYLALLAWSLSYFAITGRRPHSAARTERFFGRLNRPVWSRHRDGDF